MMTADTNVFVYVHDNRDAQKRAVAIAIGDALEQRRCSIGLQVIGELQNVLVRKLKQPPWIAARNARNLLASFDTFAASELNAEEALGLMAAGRFSYWDGLLLIAARDAGCTVMFTEDMADGTKFGPLEIVNPFGTSGPSDRARTLLNI